MKPIDVASVIGATTRVVVHREHEGRPAHAVVVSREFATDIEDLWTAVTTADRISRWLMPIEGELRLGGRYQLVGNASGTITACDRPHHLALTWEFGGGTSWVDARLERVTDRSTRLTIDHMAHVDPMWPNFGPSAVGMGWDLMVLGLYLHIAGEMGDPKEGMAWAGTDEGKRFQKLSSDDWCRADIAAGADAAEARAAADRCYAAYTGS